MTSAPESFAITLGRAAGRAMRLLRGLQRADRDDILATAILWCWEHRESYNVTVSLETWITGAIRNARQQWARGEAKTVGDLVEEIPVPDVTLAAVENRSAAAGLVRALNAQEREIAYLRAEGYTRAQIRDKTGLSKRAQDTASKTIKQLRYLIPEPSELKRIVKREAVTESDELTSLPTNIDRTIAKLFGSSDQGAEHAFADDYVQHGRVYVPEEDCRGKMQVIPGSVGLIEDYEGNEPTRRLLVNDGLRSWWIAEECCYE